MRVTKKIRKDDFSVFFHVLHSYKKTTITFLQVCKIRVQISIEKIRKKRREMKKRRSFSVRTGLLKFCSLFLSFFDFSVVWNSENFILDDYRGQKSK